MGEVHVLRLNVDSKGETEAALDATLEKALVSRVLGVNAVSGFDDLPDMR